MAAKICGNYSESGLGYCARCDWSGLMHLWPGPAAGREPYRSALLVKEAGVLLNLREAAPRQAEIFAPPKDRNAWRWFLAWAELELPRL